MLELLLLVAGLVAIVVAPDIALTIEVVAIPVVLVASWLSIIYLHRVFLRQPEPRSRFFAMLIAVSARKSLLGAWFGYLVVARIGERTGWFLIPVPSAEVSAPISGLVLLVFMSTTVAYAVTVARVRRASLFVHRSDAGEAELDRETQRDEAV